MVDATAISAPEAPDPKEVVLPIDLLKKEDGKEDDIKEEDEPAEGQEQPTEFNMSSIRDSLKLEAGVGMDDAFEDDKVHIPACNVFLKHR